MEVPPYPIVFRKDWGWTTVTTPATDAAILCNSILLEKIRRICWKDRRWADYDEVLNRVLGLALSFGLGRARCTSIAANRSLRHDQLQPPSQVVLTVYVCRSTLVPSLY